MNTARGIFRVGYFGAYWQITFATGEVQIVKSSRELVAILSCKIVGSDDEDEKPTKRKPPTIETVEEYLARGGKILRHRPPNPEEIKPPPPAIPENVKVAPSRITLDFLFRKPNQ